eukprot:45758-Eustigmatos_ZCMA.PRE.1
MARPPASLNPPPRPHSSGNHAKTCNRGLHRCNSDSPAMRPALATQTKMDHRYVVMRFCSTKEKEPVRCV